MTSGRAISAFHLPESRSEFSDWAAISREVAKRLNSWSIRYLGHDPYAEGAPRPEGLTIVSLANLMAKPEMVPLTLLVTPEKGRLINAASPAYVKHGTIAGNWARGELIDHGDALSGWPLTVAALNTFEREHSAAFDPRIRLP